ncbi:MAG TPA: polymer-forming cytoskeletal protein [Chloroflexota bacterium]|nr:polymer-forming cytoskeletal protein [Chloroflexota bacterium]
MADPADATDDEQVEVDLSADLTRGFDEPGDTPAASAPMPLATSAGGNEVGSYVNGSTFFKGLIKSSRSVGIDGKFEGEIQSDADVVIGRDAEVRGNIKAETVIISGKVVGNITCSMLEIQPTARVVGNLTPGQLLVAIGAVFRGQCFMGAEEEGEEMPEPLAEQTHNGRRGRAAA